MDLLQQATEAAAAKRLARLAELSKKSLKPLPTWDAGYDSSGRRLVQTLGQDPVAVGRPVSTGAIGMGDRTYNTGNAVDVIPHIKPVDVVPVKIQEPGGVKILFSVYNGVNRTYYIGGDRTQPTELFRAESLTGAIVNTGPSKNNFYWVQVRYDFPINSVADSRFPELIPNAVAQTSPFFLRNEIPFYLGDGVFQTATSLMLENGITPNPASFTAYRYRDGEAFASVVTSDPVVPLPVWIGDTLDGTFYYHFKRVESVGIVAKDCKIPRFIQNGFCLGLNLVQEDSGAYTKKEYFSKTADGEIVLFSNSNEIEAVLQTSDVNFNTRMSSIAKGKLYIASSTSPALPQIASGANKFDFQTLDLRTGQLGAKTVKIKPIKVTDPSLMIESISYYQ